MLKVLFVLTLLSVSVSASDLMRVYTAALQGDMASALKILDSIDMTTLTEASRQNVACIRQTFANPPQAENLPPVSKRILTAYRHYWQISMLHKATTVQAEAELLDSLNQILSIQTNTLDSASERVKDAIGAEGYFALTGVTSPYYELMIWRVQLPITYQVKLPEKEIGVHVVFLDDFVSLGWAGYATCGRSHSGGWATQDSLFALKSAYDTTSESFHVSYLAHEGRHFSDYKEFPKLEQPELEYRAKLTEIAMADTTIYTLMTVFTQQTSQDRNIPHYLADYWVAKGLSELVFKSTEIVTDTTKWKEVPKEKLHAAALQLLTANTKHLGELGSATVEQFLGEANPK